MHKEETKKIEKKLKEPSNVNRGNFLELLHLRTKDIPWLASKLGDQLKFHSQWTSPMIQNELLEIMMNIVLQNITKDVNESVYFSIIVDETADISRTEEVSICLRYLKDWDIKETFIGFFPTETTEGKVLCELVKKSLINLNINLAKVVGLCFDGAANMSGIHRGLATLLIEQCCPLGVYVHCHGHMLNLAVQDTISDIVPLRNALGTIQKIYNFLEASPKRHAVLHNIQHEGEAMVFTLKSQSVTRWSCRYEAVKAVEQQLPFIIKALLQLESDKDPKTSVESRCLLIALCDFNFVFSLHVLKVILSNTASLSKCDATAHNVPEVGICNFEL